MNDNAKEFKVPLRVSESTPKEFGALMVQFLQPSAGGVEISLEGVAQISHKNSVRCLTDAIESIEHSGLKRVSVPIKTLVPVLQGCRLEEDENMVRKWSSLLATAATSGCVDPAFVDTLSKLTPEQARFLDALKKRQCPTLPTRTKPAINVKLFRELEGFSQEDFKRMVVAVFHLGLVEMVFNDGLVGGYPHHPPTADMQLIGTTAYCDQFLEVCTFPKSENK